MTIAELAESLSRDQSTIWRWINNGVRGHKLESTLIGGRRDIPLEAVDDFFERLNQADKPACGRPSKKRQAEIAAAEKALEAAGI